MYMKIRKTFKGNVMKQSLILLSVVLFVITGCNAFPKNEESLINFSTDNSNIDKTLSSEGGVSMASNTTLIDSAARIETHPQKLSKLNFAEKDEFAKLNNNVRNGHFIYIKTVIIIRLTCLLMDIEAICTMKTARGKP